VALPAFAAVRRAAARLLLTAGHATIDISCPPGPQQQTRRGGRMLGEADRRTPNRYARCADSASEEESRKCGSTSV